ncbi:MAG: hypothetical protein IK107_05560 [Oscillospiraceae bacterium]|nr:hypothetical protein [Oscillospiraceae bacterium]
MNLFKRAAALALSVCTLLTVPSCGENTANAMKVDGTDVRAGVYLFNALTAYSDALSVMMENGATFEGADTAKALTKMLKKSDIDGITAEEWIQNKAVSYCQEMVAVDREFERLGLSLTGEELAAVENGVKGDMSYFADFYKKTGIGEQSLREIRTAQYKKDAVWKAYYGKDGSENVQDQELFDHYANNHLRFKYIEMPLKDGEGNLLKADGKAEIEKMAEDYLSRLAKKKGDRTALFEEFDYLAREHEEYVTSLSNAAVTTTDENGNTITTATTAKVTTTEATTTGETTTASGEEASVTTTTTPDTTGEETTTTAAGDSTAETTTTAAAPDSTNDETTEATTTEATTTGLYAFAIDREKVVAVSTSASSDEKKEDETDETGEVTTTAPSYTPCEKVYNWVADTAAPLDQPELIKDEECYYIVMKMDIKERMTDKDCWTESQVENVRKELYYDKYEEKIKDMADKLDVERNKRAFKRYKVLSLDLLEYQQLMYQSMYSGMNFG